MELFIVLSPRDAFGMTILYNKTSDGKTGNELNIPILYISTAGIFDGKKESYDDWDQPNPLGVYARAKYMGERYVIENAKHYLVCRAGLMMGAGPGKDKKFIQKLQTVKCFSIAE